jgi:hypothetical protein
LVEDLSLLGCDAVDLCIVAVVLKEFLGSVFRVWTTLMVSYSLDLDACSISVIFIFQRLFGLL